MNLNQRIDLLVRLGKYLASGHSELLEAKRRTQEENSWFIPEFIDVSIRNVAQSYLQKENLEQWVASYRLPEVNKDPQTTGLVMPGNIPLAGFHDLLAVFITGNKVLMKPSSKDAALTTHIVEKLIEWQPALADSLVFSERLKNCDSYIATGSNNSFRYFEFYFGKYPHILRHNRTSVAILSGNEKTHELERLANDACQYFGLGCRSVTKLFVPEGYDFIPLLSAFKKFEHLQDHHKYKNNYDYNLAIQILNNRRYMTNGFILLVEDPSFFSPISQLNFEYSTDNDSLVASLKENQDLQCIVGSGQLDYGTAQSPSLADYADGVDTVRFLIDTTSVKRQT